MTMPAACSPPTRPFTVQWPAVPPAAVGRSACAKVVTVTPAVIAGATATTDPSSGSPDNASAPATANATTGSSARRWLRPSVGRWRSRSPQTCPVLWSRVRWVQIRHNPDTFPIGPIMTRTLINSPVYVHGRSFSIRPDRS